MNANRAGLSHRKLGVGLFLGIAVVLVASVLMGRQDAVAAPRLVTDTSGWEELPSTEGPWLKGGDRFYVVYANSLCIEDAALATITSIEAADARGGLEVSGFSVFQRPSSHATGLLDEGHRLGEIADYHGSDNVGSVCGEGPLEELALELYKPESRDAWATDFTVHYVINGEPARTNLRLGVAMCERRGCNPFGV